ncbi:MAG: DVUA0089 family protein [Patescibacteria group bacterium]|nr:DVUA0089 family protein [Patescibacteria group bacterium]MDE2116678.1 DVUA0089 family protein [Patescibacteria group bacterium]
MKIRLSVWLALAGLFASAPAGFGQAQSRLTNLSCRGFVGTGQQVLVAGFVLKGTGPHTLLIRGIGPGLTAFKVGSVIPDPILTLFDNAGHVIGQNDDWDGSAATQQTFNQVGAFPLALGSKDAVIVMSLQPGLYTAQMSPSPNSLATGTGLIEVYDVTASTTGQITAELINMSARVYVPTGQSATVGVSTAGVGMEQLLFRASGPELADFDVSPVSLSTPITLYDHLANPLATNSGWCNQSTDSPGQAAFDDLFNQVGAFAFQPGSGSSAISYTANTASPTSWTAIAVNAASSSGASGGVMILEIYKR